MILIVNLMVVIISINAMTISSSIWADSFIAILAAIYINNTFKEMVTYYTSQLRDTYHDLVDEENVGDAVKDMDNYNVVYTKPGDIKND